MLAHREAKDIAAGTEGKFRVLADLISQHYPKRLLIFTNDNATVYRLSQEFLIPAITYQTPVKERHDILARFREGEYKVLAASHVLNEGVDVPDAEVAVILSGTGSAREYVQRLGRILRRGKQPDKFAILYEVVAENTSEERVSQRRRGESESSPVTEKNRDRPRQLELIVSNTTYSTDSPPAAKAAEESTSWEGNS